MPRPSAPPLQAKLGRTPTRASTLAFALYGLVTSDLLCSKNKPWEDRFVILGFLNSIANTIALFFLLSSNLSDYMFLCPNDILLDSSFHITCLPGGVGLIFLNCWMLVDCMEGVGGGAEGKMTVEYIKKMLKNSWTDVTTPFKGISSQGSVLKDVHHNVQSEVFYVKYLLRDVLDDVFERIMSWDEYFWEF
jgi:hypothetical protein